MSDLGVNEKRLRIRTDASVALSLASRRGLGGKSVVVTGESQ